MHSFAGNAVMVKCRAMYAQRLKKEDYQNLLCCTSVAEIAAYLKSVPGYRDVLHKVVPATIHRRELESYLYQKQSLQSATLFRYENMTGGAFSEYFILKNDADLLRHIIRNLNSAHPGSLRIHASPYFEKYSRLNASSASVYDFSEFLKLVENTPYQTWFTHFESANSTDYFNMELALNKRMHERIRAFLQKELKGHEKKDALEFLSFRSDIENLISVYRLKRMGCDSQAVIRSVLYENESLLPEYIWDAVICANDAKAIQEIIKNTAYVPLFQTEQFEQNGQELAYQRSKKLLRFSTEPCTVMLSFLRLTENEVKNLIRIIEGVRYQMSPEEIGWLLVGAGD